MTEWQNRIIGEGEENPEQLLANPENWRIHPKLQQDVLTDVLDEVGWVQRVIVNRTTGHMVDGHLRAQLAISRGESAIPVTYVELTVEEERKILATLDPLAAMAATDEEKRQELLAQVNAEGAALSAWLADTLALGTPELPPDVDDVPDKPRRATSRLGDVYQMGEHRLVCGDATNMRDVELALAGEHARMMFTDPPWNVAIGQDSNPRHRQRPGMENDDLSADAFDSLLRGFTSNAAAVVDGDTYIVLGASEWPRLDATLREVGYHWSATLIWAKDAFVLGRSKFHRRYEPIWYGWGKAAKSSYHGGRSRDDVWEFPRPKRSEEHPTMKPVALVQEALVCSARSGDFVFDPFLGSGTTVVAAEASEMRCAGLEIDPAYCDVIVARWEGLTGKKAKRSRT